MLVLGSWKRLDMVVDVVYLGLTGGTMVPTRFTDIQHAVDYIQKATPVSLEVA